MPAQPAGPVRIGMGAGGAPGTATGQDQSIENLLAEFQAAPSISLGDFPALDESFLRQTDDGAQSLPMPAYPMFGKPALQPQDSAYVLTPLLPSSAFGGSLGKSSTDTHHSGELSEGEDEAPVKGQVGKRARGGAARAQRTADKNRQAQKRYRERQKEKMADFERQVEELSGRVSSLMQEKRSLETRNSLLERVVQLKQETDVEKSEPQELNMYRSVALFGSLLNPMPCTVEDASRLNQDDIVDMYKTYVAALMECMRGPVDDALSPSYQRLRQLIEAHREIMLHMGRTDAKMVSKIHCTLKKQIAPPGMWARCVECMGLSAEQRAHILEARETLLQQMDAILQRRREVIQSLQGLLPESPNALPKAGVEHMKSFSCTLAASDELRESLEAEHHAVGEFIAAFYAPDLLTPVQEARMSIEAAPYKVDTLAVSNQVAAEAGPPPVDCFMTELSGLLEGAQGAGPLSLMPASSAFRNLSVPEAPIVLNVHPAPLS
ncbi:hypothetical protein WJX81_005274 [Elliptochloris bilobata]|uniref:BZIP domain-containing protein n=1 Tax=Elliptochloris bilobata TaxID=381761 RepID=A0AAW1RWQ8_9CHLO